MARDQLIVWPIYFDSHKSRKDGRRVPKELAVSSPDIEMIAKAAREAGYSVTVEKEFIHPTQERKGRIRIEANEPKTKALRKIGEKLRCHLS